MIVLNAVIILLEMKQVQQHFSVCVCARTAMLNANRLGFGFANIIRQNGVIYIIARQKSVYTHTFGFRLETIEKVHIREKKQHRESHSQIERQRSIERRRRRRKLFVRSI